MASMRSLSQQRCFHHSLREAAARCPECGHFYCRECITEHDDRVICAACLRRLARPALARRLWFAGLLQAGQVGLGVVTIFLFFYFFGQSLLSLPASFHEGTLWQEKWFERQ